MWDVSYGLCSVKDGNALTNTSREKLIRGGRGDHDLSFGDIQWAVVYISLDFRGDKHLGVVRIQRLDEIHKGVSVDGKKRFRTNNLSYFQTRIGEVRWNQERRMRKSS